MAAPQCVYIKAGGATPKKMPWSLLPRAQVPVEESGRYSLNHLFFLSSSQKLRLLFLLFMLFNQKLILPFSSKVEYKVVLRNQKHGKISMVQGETDSIMVLRCTVVVNFKAVQMEWS